VDALASTVTFETAAIASSDPRPSIVRRNEEAGAGVPGDSGVFTGEGFAGDPPQPDEIRSNTLIKR
jgi:hypothetical protein